MPEMRMPDLLFSGTNQADLETILGWPPIARLPKGFAAKPEEALQFAYLSAKGCWSKMVVLVVPPSVATFAPMHGKSEWYECMGDPNVEEFGKIRVYQQSELPTFVAEYGLPQFWKEYVTWASQQLE